MNKQTLSYALCSLVIIVMCVFVLVMNTSCAKENPQPLQAHASNGKALGHDRFHIIDGSYNYEAILVDTETGVEYLWIKPNSASTIGGLTVLVDHTGQPLIAPGFKDY